MIEIANKCVKMRLPNGNVVDILPEVFEEIGKWTQNQDFESESGGFVLGYEHKGTGNISLEYITYPQALDIRSRVSFKIRDPIHKDIILKASKQKSFYLGVWHTHPQVYPIPSTIDWNDWEETLLKDKTASVYVFFIIAGSKCIRVWVGDYNSRKIEEIFECEKEGDFYKNL